MISNCLDWVPDGVPWWDPSKEVRGHGMAIAAHLDNVERICRAGGTEAYENLEINARFFKAAADAGVPVVLPGVSPANDIAEAIEGTLEESK